MKFEYCFALLSLVMAMHVHGALPAQADSEKLEWKTDTEAAIAATKPGKIIVWVQFDSDFLKPVRDSLEFKNFRQRCLDTPTRKWLKENAVMICEPIGFPTSKIELDFGSNDKNESPVKQQSTGTCLIWLCDFNGTVCDVLIGQPNSKQLLEKTKATAQFLNNLQSRDAYSQWHYSKVQAPDRIAYKQARKQLITSKRFQDASRPLEQSVSYCVAAAAVSRERRMQERFGDNWNHAVLNHFVGFESQFFSMMLAELPFQKVSDLEASVWELIVGKRLWKADKKKLAQWIEKQRSLKKSILLRLNKNNRVWPRPGDTKLAALVKDCAVLENANAADAAFLLTYFNADTQTVSAHHVPSYFVSTSKGDVCHLLTAKENIRLTELTTNINHIEARRRK